MGSMKADMETAEKIARIDERSKNTDENVKRILDKLDNYATLKDLQAVTDRVDKIESNISWIVKAIITAFLGILGSIIGLFIKR